MNSFGYQKGMCRYPGCRNWSPSTVPCQRQCRRCRRTHSRSLGLCWPPCYHQNTHQRQRTNYLKLSAFFWFMFAKLMRDIRLKLDGTVEQLKLLYSYSTVLLLDLSLKGLIQFVHSSTAIPSQFVDDDIWCPQVWAGRFDSSASQRTNSFCQLY